MTTTVKIEAHCSADKEVVINIFEGTTVFDNEIPPQEIIIQDGQTYECYAYDDRVITVGEYFKDSSL